MQQVYATAAASPRESHLRIVLRTLTLTLLSTAAGAAAAAEAPPAIFQKLLDCRAISASAERLACFDAQVATIDGAVGRKELVIADQAQLRKARRSLFGLTLPRLSLFGGGDDNDNKQEEAEFAELESTIASTRKRPDRNWVFVLEDGAKWVQTDTRTIPSDPKPGQPIRIRRAAMGSFLANVNKQIAVRVRREN